MKDWEEVYDEINSGKMSLAEFQNLFVVPHIDAMTELKESVENGDTEIAHGGADDTLITLLRSLGFDEVCDEWEKVDKWYA